MSWDEYNDLMWQADQAYTDGDRWTAALLYEQAHQLATDHGAKQEAFEAISWAADSWFYTGEPDRGVRLLIEGRQQLESLRDAAGQYQLQRLYVMYALYGELAIDDLDRQMDTLSELALHAWGKEGSMTQYLRSSLLDNRGKWDSALEVAERSWANWDAGGATIARADIAAMACTQCLTLGRRDEAERWTALVATTDDAWITSWQLAACRAQLAKFDNDAPAARSASRQLDALAKLEMSEHSLRAAMEAVYALCVDGDEGDPASPSHLIRLRLAHQQPPEPFTLRFDWHRALACLELASLRYAAGVPLVDDDYYTTPQALPHPDNARLPTEILPRLAVFERACDTALAYAREADARFSCSWREQQVADVRQRGEAIAAVFNSS